MKINEKQIFAILALLLCHEYLSALIIYYHLYHDINFLNEARKQNMKIRNKYIQNTTYIQNSDRYGKRTFDYRQQKFVEPNII